LFNHKKKAGQLLGNFANTQKLLMGHLSDINSQTTPTIKYN